MAQGGKILAAHRGDAARAVASGHVDVASSIKSPRISFAASTARRRRSRDCTDSRQHLRVDQPARSCTASVDEARAASEGDIISLDVGVGYKGYFTDSATTVPVGAVRADAQRLLDVTQRSRSTLGSPRRRSGITSATSARRCRRVVESCRVQRRARSRRPRHRRRVPRRAAGAELRQAEAAEKLVPGLTIAIEPMVNVGGPATQTLAGSRGRSSRVGRVVVGALRATRSRLLSLGRSVLTLGCLGHRVVELDCKSSADLADFG